jgi:hypothetical protein
MDEKTKGAWLIHHTNKLQRGANQSGYEKTYLVGKAGILLSDISDNRGATVNNDRLVVLAKAANISVTFEKIGTPRISSGYSGARSMGGRSRFFAVRAYS